MPRTGVDLIQAFQAVLVDLLAIQGRLTVELLPPEPIIVAVRSTPSP
jgi:hypothetical protein